MSTRSNPRFLFAPVLLTALTLSAAATAQDTIHWMDGTVSRDVRIKEFSLLNIEYSERGSKTEGSDRVLKIETADFRDEYARGLDAGDPGFLLTTARGLVKRKPMLAQMGFLEAARMYVAMGDGTFQATLKEMVEVNPKSGFVPEQYRLKLDYYMAKGQWSSARTVAKQFVDEALNGGWPEGFGMEATYNKLLVEDLAGEMPAADLQTRYRDLLRTVPGQFSRLSDQIEVRLAISLQNSGDTEGAAKLYDGLLKRENPDANTLAGAYLGLGKIAFEQGSPSNKEPYREALLWFTRVYVLCRDEAWDSYVAESLHLGSQAAKEWGGPDSGYMRGKLRYLLERDYPDSPWAKR